MARGSTGAVEEAGPEDLNVGRWRASLTPLIPPVEPYPVTIYGTRHHISAICYQIAEELSEEKELVHKKVFGLTSFSSLKHGYVYLCPFYVF